MVGSGTGNIHRILDGWKAFVLIFFALIFGVDAVFFRSLLWKIPNETSWQTEPFYNYTDRAKSIPEKPDGEFRIILAGSSLVPYGINPLQLEKELVDRTGKRVKVYDLSHRGMNAYQLFLRTGRILDADPDLVVVPVNMVDLRLERLAVTGTLSDLYVQDQFHPDPIKRKKALAVVDQDLKNLYDSPALEYGFPGLEELIEFGPEVTAARALRQIFAFYKYKDIAFTGMKTYLSNRLSSGKSYHHYRGVPVGRDGVTHEGWTGPVFELYGDVFSIPDEFSVQYPGTKGEMLAYEGLCSLKSARPDQAWPLEKGWQKIRLNRKLQKKTLCLEVSPPVYHPGKGWELGVRLTANLGKKNAIFPKNDSTRARPYRLEDRRFFSSSDENYRELFETRILAKKPGREYLEALLNTKTILGQSVPFDAELPSIQYLQKFRKKILESGVSLFVFNAPENPISLRIYRSGGWYRDYLAFLEKGKLQTAKGDYLFKDYSDLLRIQEFYDFHHPTYRGAIDLTRRLGTDLMDARRGKTEGKESEAGK